MAKLTIAFLTGGLLAIMTQFNGSLAFHAGGFFAAWVAHGIGAVFAYILIFTLFAYRRGHETRVLSDAPWWSYSGGLFGATTVVLISYALVADLPLAVALALSLTGQITTSLVLDGRGLLGMPKRVLYRSDYISASLVFSGSVLMLVGGM